MILRTGRSRVHRPWTSAWWAGAGAWTALLGPPPSAGALREHPLQVPGPSRHPDWLAARHPVSLARSRPPPETLVVLAGQQPALAGGPALIAHKAATAIALATEAALSLRRPVTPVFLLATQDHDTTEVDHIDVYDAVKRVVRRSRWPVSDRYDMFSRARFTGGMEERLSTALSGEYKHLGGVIKSLCNDSEHQSLADETARLLDLVFGHLGLIVLESHRLTGASQRVLASAIAEPGPLAGELELGSRSLAAMGQPPPFDARDPRPLVLESRAGRRRRLVESDRESLSRLLAGPDDFSPHAALRPIVQALSLPVLAQVCGPSELLYLAQGRGLHQLFGATAPLLVPRLEASCLPLEDLVRLGEGALDMPPEPGGEAEHALSEAVNRFSEAVARVDPGLQPKLQRFAESISRRARKLAEAPAWRGLRASGLSQRVRPRGRWQDTVLAWLPDALGADDPAGYGRHLVSLSRPLEAPVHVLHSLPGPSR